jgi:hypothetical protein
VALTQLVERAGRAMKRPPRYLVARLAEMITLRMRRPRARIYPYLLTERSIVRAAGAASIDALWGALQETPFFVAASRRDAYVPAFRERYPDAPDTLIAAADRILRHEFDLLGSGAVTLPGALPWHTDFKSGREWPIEYSARMHYSELDRPSDIKVPWELSRCQHFTTLGQAYWLTGDDRYAREFTNEVTDWIARNPWGYGVNWACAMDVALRAVSWIWGFHFFSDSAACASRRFRGALLRSLFLHGDYIANHLERGDINGNHYLCDAVGLVFLGTFFRATRSGREWLDIGKAIIAEEIFNQTSADGVDFEKSTAYHRLVLEAFLASYLLLRLHDEPSSGEWIGRLEAMIDYVEAYTKPDGTIPLVGDADDGRIQKLGVQPINDHRYLLSAGAVMFGRADFKRAAASFHDEAFWLLGPDAARNFDAVPAAHGALRSRAFPDGGFFILRSDRAHVFADCGEVGMHGRGGHGHSDITSIEVWLDGFNLVTDCGAYLYTSSQEWRNRFRSTAFHNVVQVDDEELNRLIAPDQLWQLRDDARPQDVTWKWGSECDYFRGGHTAYARLEPPAIVTRELTLQRHDPALLVRDSVQGGGWRELTWRFHLDSRVNGRIEGTDVRLSSGTREAWVQLVPGGAPLALAFEPGWVSPRYGIRLPTQVLIASARVRLPAAAAFRFGVARLSAPQLEAFEQTCVNC